MFVELHKSSGLIPPYLHNERPPLLHCAYDASVVGFRRHIDTDEDGQSGPAARNTDEALPETDELSDSDINRITAETRRGIHLLRHKFVRPGRRLPFMDMFDTDDEVAALDDSDEFEVDDLDEDDDMELDLELDEEDGFMDEEGGMQVFEHNGEFYVTMYETASEDGDEDEDEEEEEEMHDAVETQQAPNDDLD